MATPAEAATMRRAIALSAAGLGTTSPNPPVGCVVLDPAGVVVGEGYHERKGEAHAEAQALAAAGPLADGATAVLDGRLTGNTRQRPVIISGTFSHHRDVQSSYPGRSVIISGTLPKWFTGNQHGISDIHGRRSPVAHHKRLADDPGVQQVGPYVPPDVSPPHLAYIWQGGGPSMDGTVSDPASEQQVGSMTGSAAPAGQTGPSTPAEEAWIAPPIVAAYTVSPGSIRNGTAVALGQSQHLVDTYENLRNYINGCKLSDSAREVRWQGDVPGCPWPPACPSAAITESEQPSEANSSITPTRCGWLICCPRGSPRPDRPVLRWAPFLAPECIRSPCPGSVTTSRSYLLMVRRGRHGSRSGPSAWPGQDRMWGRRCA